MNEGYPQLFGNPENPNLERPLRSYRDFATETAEQWQRTQSAPLKVNDQPPPGG